MWRNEREDGPQIAKGTTIRGNLRGEEDLTIEGRVEGKIDLAGNLALKGSAVIKGDVFAQRVRVAGIVVGNITATEAIELDKGARVQGDLRAPSVKVADGARFAGALEVGAVQRGDIVDLSSRMLARADEPLKMRA